MRKVSRPYSINLQPWQGKMNNEISLIHLRKKKAAYPCRIQDLNSLHSAGVSPSCLSMAKACIKRYLFVNYPDLKKSELPASTIVAWAARQPTSYTMSTGVEFGLFHPYCALYYYATSWSRRSPSLRTLAAAFWSRLMVIPQSHCRTRIRRFFISGCSVPQQLQIWLLGNHLLTLTRYLFRSDSLYSSMDKNIPYPLSRVAFPLPKPLFDKDRRFRSSTHTTSY